MSILNIINNNNNNNNNNNDFIILEEDSALLVLYPYWIESQPKYTRAFGYEEKNFVSSPLTTKGNFLFFALIGDTSTSKVYIYLSFDKKIYSLKDISIGTATSKCTLVSGGSYNKYLNLKTKEVQFVESPSIWFDIYETTSNLASKYQTFNGKSCSLKITFIKN